MTIEATETASGLLNPYALFELTRELAAAKRPQESYEAAMRCLHDGLGVDKSAVVLFDADSVMRFKAWTGISETYRNGVEGSSPWRPDEDPIPEAALIVDVSQDASIAPLLHFFQDEGIGAIGFVPVASKGRLLGKIMLAYPEVHEFSAAEHLVVQTIAAHLGSALDD